MARVTGFINIYTSGFYHSPGKPGAYDRHPGDIYATEGAALDDVHPRSHYVATVPVEWDEVTVPTVNPRLNEDDYIGEVSPRMAVEEFRAMTSGILHDAADASLRNYREEG